MCEVPRTPATPRIPRNASTSGAVTSELQQLGTARPLRVDNDLRLGDVGDGIQRRTPAPRTRLSSTPAASDGQHRQLMPRYAVAPTRSCQPADSRHGVQRRPVARRSPLAPSDSSCPCCPSRAYPKDIARRWRMCCSFPVLRIDDHNAVLGGVGQVELFFRRIGGGGFDLDVGADLDASGGFQCLHVVDVQETRRG